jgi:tyrosyl-DNA phosphodiesterase 2
MRRKRSLSPEVVEVPAAADKRAVGAAEGEEKARAAKKGLFRGSPFLFAHYKI